MAGFDLSTEAATFLAYDVATADANPYTERIMRIKRSASVVVLLATTVFLNACTSHQQEQGEPSASSTISPLAPSSASQTTPPPSGSSFKNCRGGRNIHWWVAHVENVTAADLEALTGWNLTNADRSNFDPSDASTLATWLKEGAKADNIFYAVSAQLAVAVLNVRHAFLHESQTFVLVDQANRELGAANPSVPYLETILYEFNRCQ